MLNRFGDALTLFAKFCCCFFKCRFMIFILAGENYWLHLNTLLKYLHFVFTSFARKYLVFVFNYFIATVFCIYI